VADLGIRKTPRKLGVGLFLLGLTGTTNAGRKR